MSQAGKDRGMPGGWFQGWKTSNLEPSAKLKSYGSELDLGISGKKSQMKSFTLRFLSALGFKTFPWRNPPLPGNLKLLTIQTGTPHWMTCSSFLKSLCKVDSTSSLCWLEGGQFFPRVNYIAHFGGVKQYLCWGISLITMHFLVDNSNIYILKWVGTHFPQHQKRWLPQPV